MTDVRLPMDKVELRRRARAVRDALAEEARCTADTAIARQVIRLDAWTSADAVLIYLACGSEVATENLIHDAWARGVDVLVPRCEAGNLLSWHRYGSGDALAPEAFGILEPPASSIPADIHRYHAPVVIVPGLVFDTQGFRVGYGGGYYDRFLAGFAGASIGLVREAQLVDDLGVVVGHQPYDLPVAFVVSERRIVTC